MSTPTADDQRLARLERRLERERLARREAERIAERGLRDLYLANIELDHKVEERTAELDRARRTAHAAAVDRAEFLASLSRDVRTPLNGVVGMLELLDDHVDDPQGRTWLATASASANELARLFARLVLFVQLDEPDSVTQTQFPVADVLKGVTARWTRVAARSGLLLVAEDLVGGGEITSSYELLQQLIDELLHLVVSRSRPGPLVLRAARRRDGGTVLSVTAGSDPDAAPASAGDDIGHKLIERLAAVVAADVTFRCPGDLTEVILELS